MDEALFPYLQRLESMAFFSGYPLIYAIVLSVAGNQSSQHSLKKRIFSLLPFSYALTGTLYFGLQVRNLYPDFSIGNIKQVFQQPYLVAWGLLAMLFWIPAVSKKPSLSLLHSLVFFFFLLKDIFFQLNNSETGNNLVKNDMKVYTDSIILNTGCIIAVSLIYFLLRRFSGTRGSINKR